ncbi:hypothetical protein CHARACLAT_027950 [Characodon lateralis]|uniref:Secreted protein n=1 Tax=Characodon lateralis TaxID=208331 RepID=A0ABU7EXC5_9TELE|nr:hypothetical protein [Characodon lateralis]
MSGCLAAPLLTEMFRGQSTAAGQTERHCRDLIPGVPASSTCALTIRDCRTTRGAGDHRQKRFSSSHSFVEPQQKLCPPFAAICWVSSLG